MSQLRIAAVCLLAGWTLAACGTAEVQDIGASLEDGASLDVGEDTQKVDDATPDTGAPVDAGGDQCINKFDCLKLDLKGQTPCTVPDCVKGACVFVPRETGSKCDDPTQTNLNECEETRCDENAECKAGPRPDGAGCQGNASGLNECQVTACKSGKCEITNKADKTLCGVGACKHCKEGLCSIKSADDLDDGNPCTLDSCDVNSGEQHKKVTDITVICDDGDSCTGDGTCLDGKCKASALDCDDGIACTTDKCNPEKGCEHAADSDLCSGDNPCLAIACDLAEGCTTTKVNVDSSCDDGDNECTNDDKCGADGLCAGTPVCGCKNDSDCLDKDGKQKNLCKPQICELGDDGKGLCVADLSQAVTCSEDGGVCAEVVCDPKTGDCGTQAIKEGKDCDDGNKCTDKSTCKSGECVGEVDEKKCDDSNACTLDSCDPQTGCQVDPASGACDDNNVCTTNDNCDKGGCVGEEKACDDGVTCTKDSCDAQSGKCVNVADAKSCDDDNPCTADVCDTKGADGKLAGCTNDPDNAAKCEDDNKCTITECKSGQCVVKEYDKTIAGCACTSDKACDDGNPCTIDKCEAGDCVNDAAAMNDKACATGNVCHAKDSGVCKAGACSGGKPKDCSSVADKCHTAACNQKTGKCEPVQKPEKTACDADGDKCTVDDACTNGKCVAGQPKKCGDGDQCNDPTCDKASGKCGTKPKAKASSCEDNDVCTENDTCDGKGKCIAGKPKNCGDGDQCNKASCDKTEGCTTVSKGNGVKCDDKQFCTKTDVCKESEVDGKKVGTCSGSGVPDCKADANKCEVAFCDAKANKCAVKAAPKGATCSDGSKCTLNDKCDASGKCIAGPPKTCVGNQCADPTCAASTGVCGLKNKANGTKCNDSNQCTQTDFCSNGKCQGKNPKPCKGDQCNDPTCDVKSGVCGKKPKKDGTACSDGQACTTPDVCGKGSCSAGKWTCGCKSNADCDDKNGCTTNTCVKGSDGKLSCAKKVDLGEACNDNNACTLTDKCQSNGSCKGSAKSCDDKNTCTADSCDIKSGECLYKTLSGASCSDGNACTYSDKCTTGAKCVGTKKVCNDGNGCTTDSCTTKTGACVYNANTASCSDGNACTLNDKCSNKACKAGAPKSCSDGTKCTNDKCDTKTGKCSYANAYNNYTCEKGNASRCWDGKCKCINWVDTLGSTSSAYYEYMYDTVRDGDFMVSVGQRRYYNSTAKKYYYYGFATKTDRWGKTVWEKTFTYGDTTKTRAFWGLTRNTTDKRWVAVGYSYVNTTYGTDGWIVEFDDNGTQRRNVVVRPGGYHKGKKTDYLKDVVMDKSGEFYAVGYSYSSVSTGRVNGWVYKFKKYSSYTFTQVWNKLKTDATYSNAYNGVAYNSTYNKIMAVGYTYTKANSQNGLTSLWTSTGSSAVHKNYGDTSSSQYFNRVASYSTYWMAVGNKYLTGKSNQGWMLSGYFSSGAKYQEGVHGDTSSDTFYDIHCPGSICYTVGRAYDVKLKKYRIWLRRHYYRYATSAYNDTKFDVSPAITPLAISYRSSTEVGILGNYSSNGTLIQSGYTGYTTCK